jgi:acetylornithine deacetylase/succinyl-diaminopimelate desuccinylase-like protein
MTNPHWWDVARERAVTLTSQYVQINTTNPPGNEMVAAEWLRNRLAESGVTTDVEIHQTAPGRGLLIGRVAGTEPLKPLVLNHHMDVVPAEPAQWSHPPFSGEIADGHVWGRGTLDTKSLGIMHLIALEQLRREGASFRRPVVFLAVPDEEVGGEKGMAWLVEHRAKDLDPEWVWDEGGMGLHIPGGRVMFGIAVAEKQVMWLRLVARGESGHGSLPNPDNPNARLARALKRISDQRPRLRANDVTRLMLARLATTRSFPSSMLLRHAGSPLIMRLVASGVARSKLFAAMLQDTINITTLKAGYKTNVVPEKAEATLDCRLLPDSDPSQFRAGLRRTIADNKVGIEVIEEPIPVKVAPLTGGFMNAVVEAAERHIPDAVTVPLQMPGASDSRFWRAIGVPTYGVGPYVIDESDVKRIHGVDERISIDNLELGCKIAYDVIRSLCVEC